MLVLLALQLLLLFLQVSRHRSSDSKFHSRCSSRDRSLDQVNLFYSWNSSHNKCSSNQSLPNNHNNTNNHNSHNKYSSNCNNNSSLYWLTTLKFSDHPSQFQMLPQSSSLHLSKHLRLFKHLFSSNLVLLDNHLAQLLQQILVSNPDQFFYLQIKLRESWILHGSSKLRILTLLRSRNEHPIQIKKTQAVFWKFQREYSMISFHSMDFVVLFFLCCKFPSFTYFSSLWR